MAMGCLGQLDSPWGLVDRCLEVESKHTGRVELAETAKKLTAGGLVEPAPWIPPPPVAASCLPLVFSWYGDIEARDVGG